MSDAAELVLPVVIDRKYPVPLRAASVQMDGKLEEWDALPYSTGEQPLVTGSAQDWKGPEDASAKFQVVANDEFVYVAAQVTDETPILRVVGKVSEMKKGLTAQ